MLCHPQENRAPSLATATWEDKWSEDKHHHSEHPPPFSFPQLYTLNMIPHGLEYALSQLGSPVLVSPLSNSCTSPDCSLVGQYKKQKRLWVCVSSVQQQQSYPCLITPVFITNPRHRPILATMKKIAQPKPANKYLYKYLLRSHRSGNKKNSGQNCPSALYTDNLNTNPPTRIAATAAVQTVYHALGDTFCHPDLPSHQELVCENTSFVSVWMSNYITAKGHKMQAQSKHLYLLIWNVKGNFT